MKLTKFESWLDCCTHLQVLLEDDTVNTLKVVGDFESIKWQLTLNFVLKVKHMMTNEETCRKEILTTKPGIKILNGT